MSRSLAMSRTPSALLLALLVFLPAVVQAEEKPGAVDARPKFEVDVREGVEYGTGGGEKLTLCVAQPKGLTEPAPCIVYIHGGGWRMGNQKMHLGDIKEAAADGYVSATIGYRFAPKHRHPAQIEDCKCAIRYLRAHAAELNLDPNRIAAVGFSAGAHLSMLLGAMDASDGLEGDGGWADQSSKVQCVVSYFGPANLTNTDIRKTVAGEMLDEKSIRQILTDFVGGTPEEHPEALKSASPLTYVNEGDAPMLLFQGTKDNLVPYDQAFEMVTALTNSGVQGRIEILIGKRHGWGGEELQRTKSVHYNFIREQFHKKPKRTASAKGGDGKDPA